MKNSKKVIDGTYNTHKMLLKIGDKTVSKFFKPVSGSFRRYQIEKEALQRMSHILGTPKLISSDDNSCTLVMSRLSGNMPDHLTEKNLLVLIRIVKEMLEAGVARHSMPIRDILVNDIGEVGLVDFERSTLRSSPWRIDWIVATKVSHYHLYRLIYQHQPQLLTKNQLLKLNVISKLRKLFGI